jgi:hypothetical protein
MIDYRIPGDVRMSDVLPQMQEVGILVALSLGATILSIYIMEKWGFGDRIIGITTFVLFSIPIWIWWWWI